MSQIPTLLLLRAARSQSTLAQATQMFHSGGMAPSQQGSFFRHLCKLPWRDYFVSYKIRYTDNWITFSIAEGSDGSGADGVVPLPAYVTALMFR